MVKQELIPSDEELDKRAQKILKEMENTNKGRIPNDIRFENPDQLLIRHHPFGSAHRDRGCVFCKRIG